MIIKICDMVRQILFPGYFEYKKLKSATVRYHVGELLENIEYELTKQVAKALECAGEKAEGKCRCRAGEIVQQFLQRLPWLRGMLAKDVQAAYDGDPAAFNTDEVIFSYPGVFAISVNRIAHELHILGVPMIPRIMTEYAHNLTGIDIHPGATIGEYFFIDHGTGVVIGETAVIGKGCRLYQGVTLGALSFPKDSDGVLVKGVPRHPILEDNVTVYAGATILGRITIGSGSIIGGNVWVTKDVPAGTKLVQKLSAQPTEESLMGKA